MNPLPDMTKRQAELIKLLSNNTEYKPARFYAELLNVTERTIFNDLAKLEEILKPYHLKIKKKQNYGIILEGDSSSIKRIVERVEYELNKTVDYSTLERQTAIFRRLLIENETVTYHSLSLDYYVSTTLITKDIQHLRKFLGDEVEIISDVKGTRVRGEEANIQKAIKRYAYYLIENELHNYSLKAYAKILSPLFTKEIIDSVYCKIEELLSIVNLNISEQYLKSFFIFLLILTERSYGGNHLTSTPQIEMEGKVLPNYPLAVEICHDISSRLGFTFTENEHKFVSIQLFAHRIDAKINNKYIENIFSKDIQQLISNVSKAINIDLTNDDKLYHALTYHMFPMVFRHKTDIHVYNPLLEEIKQNYTVLFQILWYLLEEFEKKYNIKLTEDDVSFITIHFRVAIERKQQLSKILIVCQAGIVTSDLILNRIKMLLPANIDVKLVAKSELSSEDLSSVDFIISSVELENVSKPIVYVSPLVSDEDLLKIYSTYLKYSTDRNERADSVGKRNIITDYLDEKYIFLQENIKTKDACLDKMIDALEKDGIVKKDFKSSVYEREKLGNTMVRDWIAVPHAMSSKANHTKVSIMTTKKPIKWNDEHYVSLIILLAVAEKDIVKIREFLNKLNATIRNTDPIEMKKLILSLEDPAELISLLQENG